MDFLPKGPLEALLGNLGVLPKDVGIYALALTHPSFANERGLPVWMSYERLEFLGDAMLSAVVSELLFKSFEGLSEGEMTLIRARLVNEEALARQARALGLHRLILLGKGEERSGGKGKPSILCGVFEAFIGALFLDVGYERLKEILKEKMGMGDLSLDVRGGVKDEKSRLQELTQSLWKETPVYEELEGAGGFFVRVSLKGRLLGEGRAPSKKEASRIAAKEALKRIEDEGHA
jgi:ribonuclease-3